MYNTGRGTDVSCGELTVAARSLRLEVCPNTLARIGWRRGTLQHLYQKSEQAHVEDHLRLWVLSFALSKHPAVFKDIGWFGNQAKAGWRRPHYHPEKATGLF